MRIASALWHAVTPLPQDVTTMSSPSGANRARSASGVEEPAVRAEVAAARPVDAPSGCGPATASIGSTSPR